MYAHSAVRSARSSETSPGIAPPLSLTRRLRGGERRSKCFLPISNASSGWEGSDYVAHVAHKMNLLSQPSPKTSGNWQNSSRWHPPQSEKAVPPLSAQQNMRQTQQQSTKPNDFFNTINWEKSFAALSRKARLRFRAHHIEI